MCYNYCGRKGIKWYKGPQLSFPSAPFYLKGAEGCGNESYTLLRSSALLTSLYYVGIVYSSYHYEIKRIQLANDVSMALETNYIFSNLIKGLTKQIVNQSLYTYIEQQQGLQIDHATQVIESSIANQIEAQHLNIEKGSPIMLIQRNTFLEDGTPVEFVKSSYRADRYKFIIQMKR